MSASSHLSRAFAALILVVVCVTYTSANDLADIRTAKPERVGMSSERLARIAPAMQKYIDAQLTPGVVTAIMRKGKLVHLSVQGDMDIASNTPMQPDAVFRIASMTKPITSVALMMLWEEGHFQLRDPVAKFLPSFANLKVSTTSDVSGKTGELVALKRPIEIRDLLTIPQV